MLDELAEQLRRHGIAPDELVPLGAGQDNTAYASADGRVVRVAKQSDPSRIRREATLLRAVATLLADHDVPLAVPEPLLVEPDAGLLVLRAVPGHSLLSRPSALAPERLGQPLGAFLTALHQADFPGLVDVDDYPAEHLLADAAESYETAADALSPERRRTVELFLAAEPPAPPARFTFSHNDLGAEHLIADERTGALVGVIDWTDAAMADPAADFARLFRDLGPAAHAAVLAHYRGPCGAADKARVLFRARCALLEDLAHGAAAGAPEYTRAALASFGHTFG